MKKGKKVRIKKGHSTRPGPRRIATIIRKLDDILGGVVVEPALNGFKFWNIEELEVLDDN